MLVDQLVNLNNAERFYLLKDFSVKNDLHRNAILNLFGKLSDTVTYTGDNDHLNYDNFLFMNIPLMKSLIKNDYFVFTHINNDYVNNPFDNKKIDFCLKKENDFYTNTFLLDYFANYPVFKNDLTINQIFTIFIDKVPFVLDSIDTQLNGLTTDMETLRKNIVNEVESKEFFIHNSPLDNVDKNCEIINVLNKDYNDFLKLIDTKKAAFEEELKNKMFLLTNYSSLYGSYSTHLNNLVKVIKDLQNNSSDFSHLNEIKLTIDSLNY